jgi:hypothetical protein
MTLPIAVGTVTILLLSVAVLLLVRRLGSDNHVLPVTTEWLNELSTDRYRPMLHLLEENDFQFLRAQKGFTPQMSRRLRRQRLQAFHGYLRMIEADFDRVSAALRLILAHSDYDRPELASLLLERRLQFLFALTAIHCRLVLFRLGPSGVDVSSLIQLLDGMRLELRTMVPATSLAVA